MTNYRFPSAFGSYTPVSHCVDRHSYGTILLSPDKHIAIVCGRLSKKWSLPKGHGNIERSSQAKQIGLQNIQTSQTLIESPLAAAIRETKEETGINLSLNKYCDKISFSSGTYFVYLLDSKIPLVPEDTKEIMEAKWVPLSDLQNYRMNMDLSTLANTKMRRITNCLTANQIINKIDDDVMAVERTPQNTFICRTSNIQDEPSQFTL